MSWRMPFDTLKRIHAANVAARIPSEPNAERVRYSGGTRGPTGEFTGRDEDRDMIAVFIARVRAPRGEEPSGDRDMDKWTGLFLEPDLLRSNDTIEWRGMTLEVVQVDRPELDGDEVFYRAHLEKRR